MRVSHLISGTAAFVLFGASCNAQGLYDVGRRAWESGDYAGARQTLLEYRKEPYGRRPDVDFMLGTSGCRLTDHRRWGGDVLDWMLYAYSLTYASRQTVASERDLCRGASAAAGMTTEIEGIMETRTAAAGMTGYGKTFYWVGQDKQPLASYPIRRLRAISKDELTARLIPLNDSAGALALASRLAPGGRAAVEGRLLLISTASHSPADFASIGATLNRFVGFLERAYHIRLPEHFLTIHLLNTTDGVRALAAGLHGLDVSGATLGYAFVDDASVVGYVEGTAVGTIMHEIFHLLVRADFGDVPQWLDEGIASLYEVSGRTESTYFGLPNWRGQVLQGLWPSRPTVRELIETEWFLFDDPRTEPQSDALGTESDERLEFGARRAGAEGARRNAVTMAMARYFALYLERRGELASVYLAVRDRGFAELEGDAGSHTVKLVEEALGRSVDALDAEFSGWFLSGEFGAVRRVVDTGTAMHVATTGVNVRTGPSTDFERIGGLVSGQRAAVFGERNGWYEVRFDDGAVGYVSKEFLTPVAP